MLTRTANGRRLVASADEKLTAFLELESAVRVFGREIKICASPRPAAGFIAWLGLRRNAHGALDRSRVACDLERVEVLLELNSPAVADRPDVGHLCVAFLSLPVKSEAVVAESHNSLAVVALKDLVRVKDEFVEARR
jgi:hypothetical protein